MSQAEKILKSIAAGEEYKALATAVDTRDYESISKSYLQVAELMKEGKKQVVEKLQTLSRQNKVQELTNFEAAFARRISSDLPHWHRINSLLKEKGVAEGEVYSVGKKGDPMVRSAEGRLVVVTGSKAGPGTRIMYRVESRGDKLDFGREAQLNGDLLYSLLNSDTLDAIRKKMDGIEDRLKVLSKEPGKTPVEELARLLTELNEVKEASEKLRDSEKFKYTSRVQIIRRKLLGDWVTRSIFDYLASLEEREIAESCEADEKVAARAMSAPGLFRRQAHEELKANLFAGQEIKGCSDALAEMEKRLDSMNAALELMEFKAAMDDATPLAKKYVEAMDVMFDNIHRRARKVAGMMSEIGICAAEEIDSAITQEFSGPALCAEVRMVFRTADDFYGMRDAVAKLRSMLGEKESTSWESAVKPYLVRKTTMAFPKRTWEK